MILAPTFIYFADVSPIRLYVKFKKSIYYVFDYYRNLFFPLVDSCA